MTLTVRLPPRVEQKLADYCTTHKVTKSEAVKRALEGLLEKEQPALAEDPSFRKFIGSDLRPGDVARHTKRLLRDPSRRK